MSVRGKLKQHKVFANNMLRQSASPPRILYPPNYCMSFFSGVPGLHKPSVWGTNYMGHRLEAQRNPSAEPPHCVYMPVPVCVPVTTVPMHATIAPAPTLVPNGMPSTPPAAPPVRALSTALPVRATTRAFEYRLSFLRHQR